MRKHEEKKNKYRKLRETEWCVLCVCSLNGIHTSQAKMKDEYTQEGIGIFLENTKGENEGAAGWRN